MLISHRHKFIFLHIPKCGGTSIRKTLSVCIGRENASKELFLHSDAKDSREFIGDKIWNSYFKFTIVRNPFSRIVSWYNHTLKKQRKRIRVCEKEINEPTEKTNIRELKSRIKEAKETIKFVLDKNNFKVMVNRYVSSKYIEEMKNRYDKFYIGQNMIDWLNDGNGIDIDYIMRLDQIDSDWEKICGMLRITHEEIIHKNKNEAGSVDYKEYYDDDTRAIVADLYKKDLEYFNYEY